MQNQTQLSSPETPDEATAGRGARRATSPRNRRLLIGATALVAAGAMTGTGFMAQSVVAEQQARIAATTWMSNAVGLDADQHPAYDAVMASRANLDAEATITVAKKAIEKADGYADSSDLEASVASLEYYELLAPERVFLLVDQTTEHADDVTAETKKAIEAEKKRKAEEAARKAAEAEAARKAAEEAAAAEAAAAAPAPAPSTPTAPANPSGAQAIARDMMASSYGWGDDQFGCLVSLWNKESGWNVYAQNPYSGAYGIPQALPGSKMSTAGADWATNAATQIRWGLGYIAGRYGTPCGAWNHSVSVGWY
ncbi:hypothetical protein ARHIZOSPH14_33640 [Agromyces rhizosphaerae]|uniref:Lytic transglycosylase domain-containing protein n=1 Tax=Agromyces rhizosphaerae TaxID=88374 RepID=A0A9W6D1L0_9MICO|nr:hypothetical protein [Agromyces rhizosphaerae]GLI29122.1 hypothetical protein ARHIZOSPH14_33640 [Agromyces rhizosphaerae]